VCRNDAVETASHSLNEDPGAAGEEVVDRCKDRIVLDVPRQKGGRQQLFFAVYGEVRAGGVLYAHAGQRCRRVSACLNRCIGTI